MILDTERLRYEMGIRGLDGQTLARAAGVSKNTVTRALHGQEISPRSLREIARALLTFPALRLGDNLVAKSQPSPRRVRRNRG